MADLGHGRLVEVGMEGGMKVDMDIGRKAEER